MPYKQEKTERLEALRKIEDEVVALKSSPLYAFRVKEKYVPVIGEGNLFAKIIFVGEAPGKNEAMTGRPFVGASGKFLSELLESVGIKREDVYITSIVKDRPPENRDPTQSEIECYSTFLDKQIEIIEPKVIATLGRFSMDYVMQRYGLSSKIEPISKAHGKHYQAQMSYGKVEIIAFYHPAAALYNGSMRDVLKKDFKILKNLS